MKVELPKVEETSVNETYGQKQLSKLSEIIGTASTLMAGDKVFDTAKAKELADNLATIVDTAVRDERSRILAVLLKEQLPMCAQYKALIKHTGSLVQASMIFAYSKGLNDTFKLIAKGANTDEQTTQKT